MDRRDFIQMVAAVSLVGFPAVAGGLTEARLLEIRDRFEAEAKSRQEALPHRRLFDMMGVDGKCYRCEVVRRPDLAYQQVAHVKVQCFEWIVPFHPDATMELIQEYMTYHLDDVVEHIVEQVGSKLNRV